MPYIAKANRSAFDSDLKSLGGTIWTVGELNYVLSRIVDNFLSHTSRRYPDYNAVIGVLECAKLELYRRLVAPYEDKKMLENGDVFRYNEETKSHD